MSHNCHHNHSGISGKKIIIAIILNIFITVSQVIGGLYAGSLSLLSDALHNFTDVMALVISYIANKLSLKSFDEKKTFGFKRAEILAALINVITLFVVAVLLMKEAFVKMIEPQSVNSVLIMLLATFSIVMNVFSVMLLKDDSKENLNMKSAYLHLLTDVFTSFAVLVGGIAMWMYKIYWVDGALSIFISLFLLYSSLKIFWETISILMDFTPKEINIKEIEKMVLKNPEIKNIHHVHIWRVNDNNIYFESHLDFVRNLDLKKATEIINEISVLLKEKFSITHTIIQPEFGAKDNKKLIIDDD